MATLTNAQSEIGNYEKNANEADVIKEAPLFVQLNSIMSKTGLTYMGNMDCPFYKESYHLFLVTLCCISPPG